MPDRDTERDDRGHSTASSSTPLTIPRPLLGGASSGLRRLDEGSFAACAHHAGIFVGAQRLSRHRPVSARVFLAYAAQIGRRRRVRGWRRPAWLRESLIVDVFYSARTSRYAKNSQCIDFEPLLRMRTYLAWTAYKIACVPPARFNPQP